MSVPHKADQNAPPRRRRRPRVPRARRPGVRAVLLCLVPVVPMIFITGALGDATYMAILLLKRYIGDAFQKIEIRTYPAFSFFLVCRLNTGVPEAPRVPAAPAASQSKPRIRLKISKSICGKRCRPS